MIKVYVKKTSSYPVAAKKIKDKLKKFFINEGVVSDSQVSVALVGKSKMKSVSRSYLDEDNGLHNVLSFPTSETKGEFLTPDKDYIDLGEIIICYPVAVEEAKKEHKLIDDKVLELVIHGAEHLLGRHHN